MIRRVWIIVTFLILWTVTFSVPARGADSDAPTKVISTMVDEVFAVLNRSCVDRRSLIAHRDELYRIASKYIDLDEVAPRVIGPVWPEQSKEAQEEFKRLFREMVFQNYADKLERYSCSPKKVFYEGEEVQGAIARVKTLVHSPDQGDVRIEYRLKKKPSGWKVYDMVVEGVSMVQNYRSQFAYILQRQNFAQMLDMLRQKVGTSKN